MAGISRQRGFSEGEYYLMHYRLVSTLVAASPYLTYMMVPFVGQSAAPPGTQAQKNYTARKAISPE